MKEKIYGQDASGKTHHIFINVIHKRILENKNWSGCELASELNVHGHTAVCTVTYILKHKQTETYTNIDTHTGPFITQTYSIACPHTCTHTQQTSTQILYMYTDTYIHAG